ncbi:MAG: hypothetical protein JNL92_15750 [Opitutaceae bacterium]|nr:hypothetical protein [Opitutaceae bacterium]
MPASRFLSAGVLLLVFALASPEGLRAAVEWSLPGRVMDLVTRPEVFGPFAAPLRGEVKRALEAVPAPAGEHRSRLLSLQVHLALAAGDGPVALDTAERIRESMTDPAERAFAGVLTRAAIEARNASAAPASAPAYAAALRAALERELARLPSGAATTALLVRQRDRLRALDRGTLLAEAEALGRRLDGPGRADLAAVDLIVRLHHRLENVVPVRDTLVASFDAALARRAP